MLSRRKYPHIYLHATSSHTLAKLEVRRRKGVPAYHQETNKLEGESEKKIGYHQDYFYAALLWTREKIARTLSFDRKVRRRC